jgi:hypothetical protein
MAVALRRRALIEQVEPSALLRELLKRACEDAGIDTSWRAL